MDKDTNVIFRVNSTLKLKVEKICKDDNLSLSSVLNGCLIDIANRGYVPINIKSKINRSYIKTNTLNIAQIKKALTDIIEKTYKNKIKKVYLFGSYAKGIETEQSDVDFRIDSDDITLFDIGNIRYDLKERLNKEIDIVMTSGASKDFLDLIKKEEICLYENR